MWFLLPQVLWKLAIILTNFLKIIFKPLSLSPNFHSLPLPPHLFPSFHPIFLSRPLSAKLVVTSFPLLFFKSLGLHFPPSRKHSSPHEGTDFQIAYSSSCMLLRVSICPARNSTGLYKMVLVFLHTKTWIWGFQVFSINRPVNYPALLKVMGSHTEIVLCGKKLLQYGLKYQNYEKIQTMSKDKQKIGKYL